jgi:hypothetical protein
MSDESRGRQVHESGLTHGVTLSSSGAAQTLQRASFSIIRNASQESTSAL